MPRLMLLLNECSFSWWAKKYIPRVGYVTRPEMFWLTPY